MGELGIGSVLAEYGAGYWPSKELDIGWVPTKESVSGRLVGEIKQEDERMGRK